MFPDLAVRSGVIPGPPISGLPEIGIFMPKSATADLGAQRGSPKSITTARDYGFRARAFGAPGNDGRVGFDASRMRANADA